MQTNYMHQHWHGPVVCSGHNNGQNGYYSWRSHRAINPFQGGVLRDHGGMPYVVNIDQAAKYNTNYRTAIWTGQHFQVTLMSINVGDDIGLEIHPNTDQFIRIEDGQGLVQMGKTKENLDFQVMAYDNYAIMVPAGTWHNLINTGQTPLKLYIIYAPPEHPFGTVHQTKAQALASE